MDKCRKLGPELRITSQGRCLDKVESKNNENESVFDAGKFKYIFPINSSTGRLLTYIQHQMLFTISINLIGFGLNLRGETINNLWFSDREIIFHQSVNIFFLFGLSYN